MIDWLNDNSGAVQALAAVVLLCVTVVLVVVTAWYARETKNIAKATGEQAEATKALAEEANRQRQAQHDAFIAVEATPLTIGSYQPLDRGPTKGGLPVKVVCMNGGPGWAYGVEPLIIQDRSVQQVRSDWERGDYNCGPSKLSRAPWIFLPPKASNDFAWEIHRGVGGEYVAVALYKDGLDRRWAMAYGFRVESTGVSGTEVIPPHLQGNLPGAKHDS